MSQVTPPPALRRFSQGESGTTAIEFALIAPFLLLVLGGICETGAFMLIQSDLQFAADRAARQILTNRVGPSVAPTSVNPTRGPNQMDIDQFKNVVCAKFSVSNCAPSIRVDVRQDTADAQQVTRFSRLMATVPALETVGPASSGGSYSETFQPSAPGEAGSLIVTYDWTFSFPGLSTIFGNVPGYSGVRRLTAISVYRNEM